MVRIRKLVLFLFPARISIHHHISIFKSKRIIFDTEKDIDTIFLMIKCVCFGIL